MKNKEKKTPKTNTNDYILSSDAESILYGLILVLISLIGLLNNGVVGEALTYIFSYLFGVFYVLVYLLFIFFGLYLMIKKTMFRLKIDLKILGALLLIVGFCIAASMGHNLTIDTFFSAYQNQVSNTQRYVFSMLSADAIYANLGGGIVGYFLTGALNSAVSETGTAVIVFIFIFVGMILLFQNIVVRFARWLIQYHKNRKALREEERRQKALVSAPVPATIQASPAETAENERPAAEEPFQTFVSPKRESAASILETLSKEENREVGSLGERMNPVSEKEPPHDFPIPEPPSDRTLPEESALPPIREPAFETDDPYEDPTRPVEEPASSDPLLSSGGWKAQAEPDPDICPRPYLYPPLSLLKDRYNRDETERKNALAREKMDMINECFNDLGIGANVISYTIGPSVTRFDVKMNAHVRTNVLSSIENDLAVRLGGNKTVRLETIVEGKNTSGIEVGNDICDTVSFKECMKSIESNTEDRLLFPLGKDISGNVISCCLDEMPHLLVCGTTGSGKSVFIHNIICSLIMRNRPEELKLMLIDPKRIEFTKYADLPHLLCPVITSTDRGKVGLMKLVDEMERRYDLFAEKGRGASNYKEYIETCEEMGYEKIPYIVMICDEFADFMSEGDKEVAKLIQRIAQKARACGIYMVIATQRPSVKVITGEIKANIPSRIALSVSSQMDSRIIIDEPGAENLMGRGDLLARIPKYKSLLRVQSAFIDSKEIFALCEHIKSQATFRCDPNFEDLTLKVVSPFAAAGDEYGAAKPMFRDYHSDEKYEEIKKYVIATGKCSTTKLQNMFGIGYSRADGILDTLEADGVIRKEGNRRILSEQYRTEMNDGDGEE